MALEARKILLDVKEMAQAIEKIARFILEKSISVNQLLIVGIRTRGVPLAHRVASQIKKLKDISVPVGILDINLYRDDLSKMSEHPIVKKTEIPVSVEGREVFLVDDVLYTGRTIRAALNALFDLGRPRFVELAVLVDRGGRELPIQADVVGIHYAAGPKDNVKVRLQEIDGEDLVKVIN